MGILEWILIIIGVWQIVFSFLLNTKNTQSAIMFKIIPFFSGIYCIAYSLIQSGLIVISR